MMIVMLMLVMVIMIVVRMTGDKSGGTCRHAANANTNNDDSDASYKDNPYDDGGGADAKDSRYW